MKEGQAFAKYRTAQMVLSILWVLMQGFLLFQQGIITDQEAEKYIYEARALISNGAFSEKKYFFYAPAILLIAFCFKTGLGVGGVVMVQLALNALSTVCLYQLSKTLAKGSNRVAFITCFCYIT